MYSIVAKDSAAFISRRTDTLSREITFSKLFLLISEKGVYSKRKEFAPKGSKVFPFRVDPFSEGTLCERMQTV